MNKPVEEDLQAYNTLLTLWQSENPIKTIKLQFLLATNAVLIGFFSLADQNTMLLPAAGATLNFIWTLSIGRTSLFQKAWKNKLDEIALHHGDDVRFQILDIRNAEANAPAWLQLLGGVSSTYYLMGTPVGLMLAWIALSLSH